MQLQERGARFEECTERREQAGIFACGGRRW